MYAHKYSMIELATERKPKKEGVEVRKRILKIISERKGICGNDIAKILYLQSRNMAINTDIELPPDCLQKEIANLRANVSYHLHKLQADGEITFKTEISQGGINKKVWSLI